MQGIEPIRILLAALLGASAAAANVIGGLLIVRRKWSHRYLRYFIALGAGFMLATALLEMVPESVRLRGNPDAEPGILGDTSVVFIYVLAGYFVVHFFEHTVAPHFHFGEETHHEEIHGAHASYTALLGLVIHTFFDGVAIGSSFLVSTWLGVIVFVAIFLHKLPEGFTVASLMLAEPRGGAGVVGDFGRRHAGRRGADLLVAGPSGGCVAFFGGRDALCGSFGLDSRSESRSECGDAGTRVSGRGDILGAEASISRLAKRVGIEAIRMRSRD